MTRRGFTQLFGAAMLAVSVSMPKFFEAVTGKATVLIKGILDSGKKFEEVVFLDKFQPNYMLGGDHLGYLGKSTLSWKHAEVVAGSADINDKSVLVEWAKEFDPTDGERTSFGQAWATEITEERPKGLVTGYEDWVNHLNHEQKVDHDIRLIPEVQMITDEDVALIEADFKTKQAEVMYWKPHGVKNPSYRAKPYAHTDFGLSEGSKSSKRV